MARHPSVRRATFFLVLSGALLAASLAVELSWRSHVREAIELGPLTPQRMQIDIAVEQQSFQIAMKALAIARILLVAPTAVVWAMWLWAVRRRAGVLAMGIACTIAVVAVWAYFFREARLLATRFGPGLQRQDLLKYLGDAADLSVSMDAGLLLVTVIAVILVQGVRRATLQVPDNRVSRESS